MIRLVDESISVLKHIALRGGKWPSACAASILGLKKHLPVFVKRKPMYTKDSIMPESVPSVDHERRETADTISSRGSIEEFNSFSQAPQFPSNSSPCGPGLREGSLGATSREQDRTYAITEVPQHHRTHEAEHDSVALTPSLSFQKHHNEASWPQ